MTADAASKNVPAAVQSPEEAFEEYLLSIHRLANTMSESELLVRHLTIGEWAVLSAIANADEPYLHNIVHRSGVSRQRINTVLRELEARQLVVISPITEGDRRRRIVAATSKGLRLRLAILGELKLVMDDVVKGDEQKRNNLAQRFSTIAKLCNRFTQILRPPVVAGKQPAAVQGVSKSENK